jgi:thiosulfate dehydrogenase [quinone] large subunit
VEPEAVTHIPEPPIAKFLFSDTRMACFWLLVRLYTAYEWLTDSMEKPTGTNFAFGTGYSEHSASAQWVFTSNVGAAIAGFATGALKQVGGTHPNVQDWYGNVLTAFVIPHASFWAHLITFGEAAVGLGLLLGALIGIAAFFGFIMNINYLLAGTVSTNPIVGFALIVLVLAWRVAGQYGVDRYLLLMLGTPWTRTLVGKPAGVIESPQPKVPALS